MSSQAKDDLVPREMHALLSNERLIVRETKRPVTPFGGVLVFVEFLRRIGLVGKIRNHMPICWRSPNAIDPTSTFIAFLVAVLAGAKRFAHANSVARRSGVTGTAGNHALSDRRHDP